MAKSQQLNYPTEYNSEGIWLLPESALLELDSLISEAEKEFKQIRDQGVKNAIRREQRRIDNLEYLDPDSKKTRIEERKKEIPSERPYSILNRTVEVDFQSEATCKDKTFKNIITLTASQQETPRSFTLNLECGEATLQVQLKSKWYTQELSIRSVLPSNPDVARTVYLKLEDWAEKYRRPLWQRFWASNNIVLSIILLVWLYLALTIATHRQDPSKVYNKEAFTILSEGISDSNRDRAIEIILGRVTSQHPSAKPVSSMPTWFWWHLAIIFLLFVLKRKPPKNVLGFANGKKELEWQEKRLYYLAKIPYVLIVILGLGVVNSMLGAFLYDRLFVK